VKRVVVIGLLGAAGMMAQAPEFEVASVRQSTSGINGVRGGCHGIDSTFGPNEYAPPPLGRCVITDGRLSHMIAIAYQLNSMGLIKNATDWMISGDARYTIQAKADDPEHTTEKQLLAMLQALLVERFRMKFHRENKEESGYALVVGKNGSKLQASKGEESGMSFGSGGKPQPGGPVNLNGKRLTIASLAQLLTALGPGPVNDETGLKGVYDIRLSWDDTAGPSLFTALQEQLGLKLESRKVPVSYFVIESAQKPREN
jgi:uncharacterized protein (TIGR03435 family)